MEETEPKTTETPAQTPQEPDEEPEEITTDPEQEDEEVEEPGEEETGPPEEYGRGLRKKKPTQRAIEYEIQRKEKMLNTSIRNSEKQIQYLKDLLHDCKDKNLLEREHSEFLNLVKEIEDIVLDLLDLQPEYQLPDAIENIKEEGDTVVRAVRRRISELQDDNKSASTRGSRSSRSSRISLSKLKVESAAKVAGLEAELIFFDREKVLIDRERSMELERQRLSLQKKLAVAKAQDEATTEELHRILDIASKESKVKTEVKTLQELPEDDDLVGKYLKGGVATPQNNRERKRQTETQGIKAEIKTPTTDYLASMTDPNTAAFLRSAYAEMESEANESRHVTFTSGLDSTAYCTSAKPDTVASQYSAPIMASAVGAIGPVGGTIHRTNISPSYVGPRAPLPSYMRTSYETPPTFNTTSHRFAPVPKSTKRDEISGTFEEGFQTMAKLMKKPAATIEKFDGNPLLFRRFIRQFNNYIGAYCESDNEKLTYLEQFTTGEAHKVVLGYSNLGSSAGYTAAMFELQERYGNEENIACAYVQRALNWPVIKLMDVKALDEYSIFLKECLHAIQEVGAIGVLEYQGNLKAMIERLPYQLHDRWRSVVDYKTSSGNRVRFADLVEFVSKEARKARNPVYGLDALKKETSNIGTKSKTRQGVQQKAQSAISFATDVAVQANEAEKEQAPKKPRRPCHLCQSREHTLDYCPLFLQRSLEDRRKYVMEEKLCFACLGIKHQAKKCKFRKRCRTCTKLHPTSLHRDQSQSTQSDSSSDTQTGTDVKGVEATSSARVMKTIAGNSTKTTLVIPVFVSHVDSPDKEVLTYAALDSQSDSTFVSEKTRHQLNVSGVAVSLKLSTMYRSNECINTEKISNLQVRGYYQTQKIPLQPAYVSEEIPMNRNHIPTNATAQQWPHLQRISSEMPPLLDVNIGLLIGYESAEVFCSLDVIPPTERGEPYAQKTILGWAIVGGIGNESEESSTCHRIKTSILDNGTATLVHQTRTKEVIVPNEVSKLLDYEFLAIENGDDKRSLEDNRFINILTDGIKKREDGHFEMPLPFKVDNPSLPNNRCVAEKRLMGLKRRLLKDRAYRDDYMRFMKNMVDKGFAEKCDDSSVTPGKIWYIPHHGVYHPKKKKIRIVFDASSRYQDICLNDLLIQGPDLTNTLLGVLSRFRQEPIAICCDIEQMFYQFFVPESDRNFLRFLWWDGDIDEPPVSYRMTVHLFGATSSPGCANFGLKQAAVEGQDRYGLKAAEFVKRDFYVDDGLTSVGSVPEAVDLIKNATQLCNDSGIRLHKVASNSQELMEAIPESDRAKCLVDLDLSQSQSIERVLGIEWVIQSDHFQFKVVLRNTPTTRRGILSAVAQVYDPLGILAPVILKGRQILQDVCREKMEWDDPLPQEIISRWMAWRDGLTCLSTLRINRCYKPRDFGEATSTQIHHFSDGSMVGYGQCSYLRMVNKEGCVHCCLVMGKARVAPIKQVTVPRLELSAAVLSVKVANFLERELKLENIEHHFWTDSEVVLSYINNEAKRFHIFVANRVQKIRDHTSPRQWKHVKGEDNPADLVSRGCTTAELLNKRFWFDGPEFLWAPTLNLATTEFDLADNDPEVKRSKVLNVVTTTPEMNEESEPLDSRFAYFSSWKRLCKAVANCLLYKRKLLYRIRCKKNLADLKPPSAIEVEDLREAEVTLLKIIQRRAFSTELAAISGVKASKRIPKNSSLYKLDPYVDESGLLRIGGRLQKASSPLGIKHPIILPKSSHVTLLIAKHIHEQSHQGRGITIGAIREAGFWIVGCRRTVGKIIQQCVT